jgi:hypothetical protein
MPSLSELQREFAAAILAGDGNVPRTLRISSGRQDAAARLAIYRNNVFANYRKALAATYPVVQALVGGGSFGAAVDAFVRACPSHRGDVNRYGGELAHFLAGYAPAQALSYLPDLARLEWAIDQANIAGEAGMLDFDALAAVPPDTLGGLRFTLHPSARLLASSHPIFRIWQAHQPGRTHDERVDRAHGAEALLVLRGPHGVVVHRLASGVHAFLLALGDNATLDEAVERALAEDAGFELGEALRIHVGQGTIVAFHSPRIAAAEEQDLTLPHPRP